MASEGHKRFRRIFDEFNMQRLAQGIENARNLKCISHGYWMFKNCFKILNVLQEC